MGAGLHRAARHPFHLKGKIMPEGTPTHVHAVYLDGNSIGYLPGRPADADVAAFQEAEDAATNVPVHVEIGHAVCDAALTLAAHAQALRRADNPLPAEFADLYEVMMRAAHTLDGILAACPSLTVVRTLSLLFAAPGEDDESENSCSGE